VATDWGNVVGTLDGTSIEWANGSVWTYQTLTGPFPDLGGLWDVGGQNTRILQTNDRLTFVNRSGGTSSGHFVSATEVMADDWGPAQGILAGDTLTWTVNGIVWARLPDVGGPYVDQSGAETGISRLERALTFTDETGQVSHGSLISPTRVLESDGAQRGGTIAGNVLTWDGAGPVWTRLPDLRGDWSVASNDAPTYVEQSGLSLLFIDDVGAVLRGGFVSSTQAQMSLVGAPNPPIVDVGITGNQVLDFGNGLLWNKSNPNALDSVFADHNLWPFV
jgi:hypothetical protein